MLYAWGASFIRLAACIATDPAASAVLKVKTFNNPTSKKPIIRSFEEKHLEDITIFDLLKVN